MSTQNPEDREFQELLQETPLSPEAPEGSRAACGHGRGPIRAPTGVEAAFGVRSSRFGHAGRRNDAALADAGIGQDLAEGRRRHPSAASFFLSVDETHNGTAQHVEISAVGSRIDIKADKGERVQIDAGKICVYEPRENTLTTIDMGSVVGPK